MAVALLFTMAPQTVMAEGDGPEPKAGKAATVEITGINDPKDGEEIEQGTEKSVSFSFEINLTEAGQSFAAGDTFSVETNIGDLFEADWKNVMNDLEVKDTDGTVLATISVASDTVTFTIAKGATEKASLTGKVVCPMAFTARDLGATSEQPVEKELVIGEQKQNIIFTAKPDPDPSPDPDPDEGEGDPSISHTNPGTVDIDTFWKNAWEEDNKTSGKMAIEVNPKGSLDLYGSTTYPEEKGERKPAVYSNMYMRDEIPEHGYVDLDSLTICASVPYLEKCTYNFQDLWHGQYDIPEGTYFARRAGTMRYDIMDQMQQLVQKSGETEAEFTARITSTSLSWGVYRTKDNTEIFLCNFGGVGDPDNNNGLYYKDFDGQSANYAAEHPEIFGDEGITGGNIMSYYVEFKTYYPYITSKTMTNSAALYNAGNRIGGNTSGEYEIFNNNATGVVNAQYLALVLQDEETKAPIEGAEFVIQVKDGAGWKDTNVSGTTDANGRLVFNNSTQVGPFPENQYRIIQKSFAPGYSEDSTKFTAYPGVAGTVLQVNSDGTFKTDSADSIGFGTIVTNKRLSYSVVYKFKSQDGSSLPKEVTELKPEDTNIYYFGDVIIAEQPEKSIVITDDGVWSFEGYDEDKKTVSADTANQQGQIVFTGTWSFTDDECIIRPEDQTIYTGGTGGDESNTEFPRPIYLIRDKENGVSDAVVMGDTEFFVDGELWENQATEYPFTVKYYSDGKEITTDESSGDFTARIELAEGVDPNKLTMSDGRRVSFEEGTLRIRYVSDYEDASDNALTTNAQYYTEADKDQVRSAAENAAVADNTAVVLLPQGTKILLNGNDNYPYPDGVNSQIGLFYDTLLPATAGGDVSVFEDMLSSHAKDQGYEMDNWNTQYRYLDLVDINNSNAWVSSSEGSEVFWPYPEGADVDSDIRLLHFRDLHREYRMTGEDDLEEQISASKVEIVNIEKTESGIWFHIPESGFSPFVLTWQNSYPVTFEFVSGTEGKDLPDEVMELLPKDYSAVEGTTAAAPKLAQTLVNAKDEDGFWTFKSWAPEGGQTVTTEGVEFTGTWEYTENTYGVSYKFESGTDGQDLPQSVLDLLPADSRMYPAGETVAAVDPSETKVTDGDGYWTFKGWDSDEKEMEKGGITFTGTWEYTLNTYKVTYEFVSGTDWMPDLPQSVMDLLPSDNTAYPAGIEIAAKAPEQTEVSDGDGVWTFQGWDRDTRPAAAGAKFTGTWTFRVDMSDLNMIPEITAEDKTINVGDEFDPLKDPTAFDKEDGDITENLVVIKNEVDTSTAGQYEVTYKVTDSEGASAIKTIVVTVVDNSEPETPDDKPTPEEPDNPDEKPTPDDPDGKPTPEEPNDPDDKPTPEEPDDRPAADKPDDTTDKPAADKPAESGKPASEVVQTGDNANPVFWIILSVMAGAAIVAAAGGLYNRNQGRTHRRRK